jgi:hypothetical protein
MNATRLSGREQTGELVPADPEQPTPKRTVGCVAAITVPQSSRVDPGLYTLPSRDTASLEIILLGYSPAVIASAAAVARLRPTPKEIEPKSNVEICQKECQTLD